MSKRSLFPYLVFLIAYSGLGPLALAAQDQPGLRNVDFPGPGGVTLRGYLAQPDAPGPHPVLLVVHEWWGLTQNITKLADRLAARGYLVLAPDLYRGPTATTAAEAKTYSDPANFPRFAADADAALAWIKAQPGADASRTASLGFCFGGRQSLFAGTRHGEFKATVILYGSGLIGVPEQVGKLGQGGPVLGIFGAEDKSIPAAQRALFAGLLADKKIAYTEKVYPGVGHAFVKDATIDKPGPAAVAWAEILAFLKKNLG